MSTARLERWGGAERVVEPVRDRRYRIAAGRLACPGEHGANIAAEMDEAYLCLEDPVAIRRRGREALPSLGRRRLQDDRARKAARRATPDPDPARLRFDDYGEAETREDRLGAVASEGAAVEVEPRLP